MAKKLKLKTLTNMERWNFCVNFLSDVNVIRMVKSVISRYMNLDSSKDFDDYMQDAFLAVWTASLKYDDNSKLSFKSFCYWYLQKAFAPKNTQYEVEIENDGKIIRMSYKDFLKIKRTLPKTAKYRTVNLFVQLDDYQQV